MSDNPMIDALMAISDHFEAGTLSEYHIETILRIYRNREKCLDLAVSVSDATSSGEMILHKAKAFESYLDGRE